MISFLARSSSIAPCFSATCQTVPSLVRPIIPAFLDTAEKVFVEPFPRAENAHSLSKYLSQGVRLNPSVTTSLAGTTQVRLAHTDVQFPDYTEYRRDSVKSPHRSSQQSSQSRKAFNYMIVAAASVPATYMTKTFATQLVSSMAMSADVLALAKVEVKLADIPEGKNVTIKWRGKPLFVRHRTAEEIEKEQDVPLTELKHPETDADRAKKPDWLVVIGVCTHLGCVPVANVGDYGGYYCPCHGSHYDASGRIRKGPAPLNLEVPEYSFPDEETLIVG